MSDFSDIFAPAQVQIQSTFGDEAIYSPRTGDSYTITLVFASGEAVQQTTGAYATAWAPVSSFTGGEPMKGDTLQLDSITYRVDEVERDSQNGRLLKLSVRNLSS